MPSLPRIKRTRPRSSDGEVLARPEPRVQELSANGLTWIHLDAPTLEEAILPNVEDVVQAARRLAQY